MMRAACLLERRLINRAAIIKLEDSSTKSWGPIARFVGKGTGAASSTFDAVGEEAAERRLERVPCSCQEHVERIHEPNLVPCRLGFEFPDRQQLETCLHAIGSGKGVIYLNFMPSACKIDKFLLAQPPQATALPRLPVLQLSHGHIQDTDGTVRYDPHQSFHKPSIWG